MFSPPQVTHNVSQCQRVAYFTICVRICTVETFNQSAPHAKAPLVVTLRCLTQGYTLEI